MMAVLKNYGLLALGVLLLMGPFHQTLKAQDQEHGIKGQEAPDWDIDQWIDGNGQNADYQLSDFRDQVTVVFCFQSWCPGCHKYGFPNLKHLVNAFKQDKGIRFVAVQTVFEGFETNTSDKLQEMQQRYELNIPFGHDDGGGHSQEPSHVLSRYRTGGTPWFIVIDKNQQVVFNHYSFKKKPMEQFLAGLIKQ